MLVHSMIQDVKPLTDQEVEALATYLNLHIEAAGVAAVAVPPRLLLRVLARVARDAQRFQELTANAPAAQAEDAGG